jgi:non-ribosomal peptide synthase protein (TIGR01720 family)
MVPAAVIALTALPRTSNGKIDRAALAREGTAHADTGAYGRGPDAPTEHLLMTLWEQVLGRPVPSIDAGFFALGGDSLSSIRLVATARRHGLVFSPQEVFEHQTVAALARIARMSPQPVCEQDVVVGDLTLTPIQRMLLGADLPDVARHNMSILLASTRRLRPESLAIAVEHLLRHHDVLRLRVRREGVEWHATIAGLQGAVPFEHHDLSAVDDAQRAPAIEAIADALQASLDLEAGPILRVASFDLGPDGPSRLLVIVHHLACDAASWPILLEDLATVYEQVDAGNAIALPPKTTSYRTWARRLAERDASDEAAFWRHECAEADTRHRGQVGGGRPSLADVACLSVALDGHDTERLLLATAEAGVTVETALLAALVTELTAQNGAERLLVFLERHGRMPLGTDMDVSRTVGWFTAVFPVCLPVAESRRPHETMLLVDHRLRQIPEGGIGWGLLNFAGASSPNARREGPYPDVSCNYLGRVDPPLGRDWSVAPESAGREVGRRGTRPTTLDVVGSLAAERLHIAWHYDRARYRSADVAIFADHMLAALRELADADGSGRTS